MNASFATSAHDAPAPSAPMLPPLSERRTVRKAVILAAGRGRRMGKLTADRPKGALEVGGHALIDWQIEALRAAGITEIAVVTGHKASALAGRDVEYIHNPEWATGTQVDTLITATDWVGGDPAIISYSDIIYHPCAALALLERPGDIVVAYDADHRWLWKRRFGNWLKDSESFKLGPGQILSEIGRTPMDVEELDGQFMGLTFLTSRGFAQIAEFFHSLHAAKRSKVDFTGVLGRLINSGCRVDTAANLRPWVEIDNARDLALAEEMVRGDEGLGNPAELVFPPDLQLSARCGNDENAELSNLIYDQAPQPLSSVEEMQRHSLENLQDVSPLPPIENIIAIQNWGRSGSTLLQSLLDDHPQILSTPNFYSRHFYSSWAATLARCSDSEKIDAFLSVFRQWWDSNLLDAAANLHRLGSEARELAVVDRACLESSLRSLLPNGTPITRKTLFEAGHVAYARARGQVIANGALYISFPIHGEPRGVAAAILEDYPRAKFLHTVRDPINNLDSTIGYYLFHRVDQQVEPFETVIDILFNRHLKRGGRDITLFGDSPYFRWTLASDQTRALRFEDLKSERAAAVSAIAQWIGIELLDSLETPTWNGKACEGRPDLFGAPARTRNRESDSALRNITAEDSRRLRKSLDIRPTIFNNYPKTYKRSEIISKIFFILSSLKTYSWEFSVTRNRLLSLEGLLNFSLILPKSIKHSALEQRKRERIRALLINHASGASYIRRNISDTRKSGAIHGTILLTESNKRWTAKTLFGVNDSNIYAPDEIRVEFLDRPLPPSLSLHLTWLLSLTLGHTINKTTSYVRLRIKIILWNIRRRRSNIESIIKLIDITNNKNY